MNTAITLAAAEGIISARYLGNELYQQGGVFVLVKIGQNWAKSLMCRMGLVKRKVSNAGKVLPAEY